MWFLFERGGLGFLQPLYNGEGAGSFRSRRNKKHTLCLWGDLFAVERKYLKTMHHKTTIQHCSSFKSVHIRLAKFHHTIVSVKNGDTLEPTKHINNLNGSLKRMELILL